MVHTSHHGQAHSRTATTTSEANGPNIDSLSWDNPMASAPGLVSIEPLMSPLSGPKADQLKLSRERLQ